AGGEGVEGPPPPARELVGGTMSHGGRDRLPTLRPPVCDGLVGPGIDQIEIDPPEMTVSEPDRRLRFRRRVAAAKEPELRVIERLDAEGQAVDARGPETFEPARLDARGIGFKGDLEVR